MNSDKGFRAGLAALAIVALSASVTPARAQQEKLDDRLVALTYHKITGEALDTRAAAERTDAVRRASGFDRPEVLKAETARLDAELAASDPSHEFVVRVGDNISQYDHDKGEFSIGLFRPGFYVQVNAFGQMYQLVFANADVARAIPMPKEEARAFDARLIANGRSVTNEIHFRVIGQGDPAGAVTGARVVRAQITSARLLDRANNVVYTPRIVAGAQTAAAANGATASATGSGAGKEMDFAHADVAGFRVGLKAKDLEPSLARYFGPVTRRERGKNWYPGYAASLVVNEMGCYSLPGRRPATPGAVCVTAFVDESDVVRSIRIERVFPWLDAEVFRATMVKKYGAVADARQGGQYALGWGPAVDQTLVYDRSGPHTAVAAYYLADDDYLSRSGNALPYVRVVLQLVDAPWAAARAK